MLALAGQPFQPEAICKQQMIERAVQVAEEHAGRATVLFLAHVQCGYIETAIGPVVVVGKLPEAFDAHRQSPIQASRAHPSLIGPGNR